MEHISPQLAAMDGTATWTESELVAHPRAALVLVLLGGSIAVGAAAALGPLYAAAALLVTVVAAVVVVKPAVGGVVLVGVVPAVSGLRRGFPVPGLRASEILIGGLSVLILLTLGRGRWSRWRWFDWLVLAYGVMTLGLGSLDLLQRGAPFTVENIGTLVGPFQFLLLYRAALVSLPSSQDRGRALSAMLLCSVPVAALAILQEANVPGVRAAMMNITGSDAFSSFSYQHLARATGPFPHWHMLGGYLFSIIFVAAGLLLSGVSDILRRRWIALVFAVDLIALMATITIAPIVAGVAGCIVIAVWMKQGRRMALWLGSGAAVVAIAFGPLLVSRYDLQFASAPGATSTIVPQTVGYRISVWEQQYLPAVSGYLVTGYGPDLPNVDWQFTESVYLTMILRGGVPLLVVFLGLMAVLYRQGRVAARETEVERSVAGRAVAATVVALFFIHFISPYFVTTGPPHVLFALAAVTTAGLGTALRRHRVAAEPASTTAVRAMA